MIKSRIVECMKLTEQILVDFYHGHHELVNNHLHKNCLWIGANTNEYHRGKDMIIFILSQYKTEIPGITLTSKEFECVSHERSSCVIVGRYIAVIDRNAKEIFRDMQRVTFVWKEEKGELFIYHMHISDPLTMVRGGEVFPHQVSVYTKEYVDRMIEKEIDKLGSLIIKDDHNTYQKIAISDITYIEGFDTNAIFHTLDGDILAKSLLADVEKQLAKIGTDIIVRVHRSHMVNKYYVNSIRRYELGVAKKYIVPISKQRYQGLMKEFFISDGEKENG